MESKQDSECDSPPDATHSAATPSAPLRAPQECSIATVVLPRCVHDWLGRSARLELPRETMTVVCRVEDALGLRRGVLIDWWSPVLVEAVVDYSDSLRRKTMSDDRVRDSAEGGETGSSDGSQSSVPHEFLYVRLRSPALWQLLGRVWHALRGPDGDALDRDGLVAALRALFRDGRCEFPARATAAVDHDVHDDALDVLALRSFATALFQFATGACCSDEAGWKRVEWTGKQGDSGAGDVRVWHARRSRVVSRRSLRSSVANVEGGQFATIQQVVAFREAAGARVVAMTPAFWTARLGLALAWITTVRGVEGTSLGVSAHWEDRNCHSWWILGVCRPSAIASHSRTDRGPTGGCGVASRSTVEGRCCGRARVMLRESGGERR